MFKKILTDRFGTSIFAIIIGTITFVGAQIFYLDKVNAHLVAISCAIMACFVCLILMVIRDNGKNIPTITIASIFSFIAMPFAALDPSSLIFMTSVILVAFILANINYKYADKAIIIIELPLIKPFSMFLRRLVASLVIPATIYLLSLIALNGEHIHYP